jgi:hypothetical protein
MIWKVAEVFILRLNRVAKFSCHLNKARKEKIDE